jgi:hypothetical protein
VRKVIATTSAPSETQQKMLAGKMEVELVRRALIDASRAGASAWRHLTPTGIRTVGKQTQARVGGQVYLLELPLRAISHWCRRSLRLSRQSHLRLCALQPGHRDGRRDGHCRAGHIVPIGMISPTT